MTGNSQFFNLQYLSANQSQKEVYVNNDLAIIDSFLQPTVIDTTRMSPPPTPNDQDKYIVPSGASGVWTGKTDLIAVYQENGTTWTYTTPRTGWTVYSQADHTQYTYNGSAWVNTTLKSLAAKTATSIAYTDGAGIIHQSGITATIGSSSSLAITLPVALTTAAVGVQVTPMTALGTTYYATCSTTTLTIYNGAVGNVFSWTVIGY
jgi:hypothetical protein